MHARALRPCACLPVLLLAALLLLPAALRADNGRGLHKKIYAVPAPGPVKIDGDLSDWDVSGQIRSYVVAETAETMSAKLAMMYDGEALYVSGVVRDTSPMMNRHDPKVDPEKAWDADVCQLWFSTDPDLPYPINASTFTETATKPPVATAYLWYFTDRQEPCLALFRSMVKTGEALRPDLGASGVIPPANFQAAYKKADDGLGFTFEYRLPFATLGLKRAPHGDDLLAACCAVFWGREDGLKTAGGHAWCYDVMSGPGFPFQSSTCWGKLAFSAKGNLPKALVEEGLPPEPPLPLTFAYDLPKDAQVTVQLSDDAGNVRRILVAQGERRAGKNLESWNGLADQGQPLSAGHYRWQGVQHGPITWKALFSAHNSGMPPWPTADNKGGWGADHGNPTTVCAIPGGLLLAWTGAEYGWGIIRVDETGRKQWGSKHGAIDLASDGEHFYTAGDAGFDQAAGISIFAVSDGRPLNFANNQPHLLAPPGGDAKTDTITGLAWQGGHLYASFAARNLVASYGTAKGELEKTWPVPAPGRLAVRPDGSLAVLSAGTVVALAVTDGKVTPLVTSDLDTPSGLAVGKDGTVFVANAGKRQDVTAYDASGKFLRAIGKAGGRPAIGRYDRSGLYQPGGIALDSSGKLWVAETTDSPKRFSVWDTSTGANLAEYFGGSSYFGYGYIDPAKPGEMYAHNVLWAIDWKALKVTPTTTIWRKLAPDMIEEPNPAGYAGVPRLFTAKDGQQYLWAGAQFKSVLLRREGDVFKPFVALISVYDSPLYGGQSIPYFDEAKPKPNGNWLWQDANGDQRVQASEVVKVPDKGASGGIQWVDADLNLYTGSGHKLAPVGKTAAGYPQYDVTQATATPASKVGGYLWLDPDGSFYRLAHGKGPGLVKWAADGTQLWSFPNQIGWHSALNLPMVGPGKLHGMTGPMGVAGDFTANMTYFGANHVFTRDGIYVAALLEDGRLGKVGADTGQPEGQGGQFVKLRPDPAGPERYFIIHGGQDSRVWEVLGLDTVQRLPGGEFTLAPAEVDKAAAEMAAYRAQLTQRHPLTIARGRTALDLAEPITRSVDGDRRFEVRAAYDATNLYLRYDVTAPAELVNAYTEPRLLFKGGNCLDLQFAADPAADAARKTPAAGDVRLLITRQQGKAVAMRYRPVLPDFKGEPIILKSPTGQEKFDDIAPAPTVTLDYKKNATGFTATATIPLDVLGWTPKPGSTVKVDLGYLFGNPEGTAIGTRAYWHNNSFSANVTNDIPNESRLEPKEWGEALVE